MTKILTDRIRYLHLNPHAPYPSEVFDGHEAIRQWRLEQRKLSLVDCYNHARDDQADDSLGDLDYCGAEEKEIV